MGAVLARNNPDHLGEDARAGLLGPRSPVGRVCLTLRANRRQALGGPVDFDEERVLIVGVHNSDVRIRSKNGDAAVWRCVASPARRLGIERQQLMAAFRSGCFVQPDVGAGDRQDVGHEPLAGLTPWTARLRAVETCQCTGSPAPQPIDVSL
jgi:hypothetical protein